MIHYNFNMVSLSTFAPAEQKALEELKRQLRSRFTILDMKLYGSKARGESTPESDIDIMIELEDRDYAVESEIYDTIYDINLEYDVFISPLFISRRLVIDGPLSESPIYKSIQKNGLTI